MSGRGVATDVRSRTKLQPILGQIASSAPAASGSGAGQSEGYLDALEESLNVRVDGEVELLASGLAELVALTEIDRKDRFQVAQDSFQSAIRTESIIRAAQNLLSLTHSLKLLHLFEDASLGTENREKESLLLLAQIDALKLGIARPSH